MEGPKFERPVELEDEKKIDLSSAEKADLIHGRSEYLADVVHEQAKQLEEATKINGIDHLTGARNRQDFDEELDVALKMLRGELAEKRAGEKPLSEISLILLDADHFKNINDTYGHPGGDEALKAIARTLRENIRDVDIAARWGGEEFAVLLKGVPLKKAEEIAEELRNKISQITIPDHPGMQVTASFGVVSSAVATEARELVKKADSALYAAKHSGRNRVVTFVE